MSEQILSQEEIDALLGAMASGDVDLEPDENQAEEIDPSEIEAYDLTSKNILLQNQFYALEEVNDKFTKFMKNFLTTSIQQKIDAKFKYPRRWLHLIVFFKDFLHRHVFIFLPWNR